MSDELAQSGEIAQRIATLFALAVERNRPLFVPVLHRSEDTKLSQIEDLSSEIAGRGFTSRIFDPVENVDHGLGNLYHVLPRADSRTLGLVTRLPHREDGGGLDVAFLKYLNLYRDFIAVRCLRLVLYLHVSEAEDFISLAGDLWDVRHHTYRIDDPAAAADAEAAAHVERTRRLIEETSGEQNKAALLLDLSNWLFRRRALRMAHNVALEGLALVSRDTSTLRERLELALGRIAEPGHRLSG